MALRRQVEAEPPDGELVRRAREGDRGAFGTLVARHQGAVFGLARRMIADTLEAEEVTQDVFLKVFQALDGFREEAAFGTWLYRITVNAVRDRVASRRHRDRASETSLDALDARSLEPVSSGPTPDEETSQGEMAAHFATCLEMLEPHLREAFLLRHQEDLGYAEIAAITRVSVSNAKVRVHRARALILDALRERGFEV